MIIGRICALSRGFLAGSQIVRGVTVQKNDGWVELCWVRDERMHKYQTHEYHQNEIKLTYLPVADSSQWASKTRVWAIST